MDRPYRPRLGRPWPTARPRTIRAGRGPPARRDVGWRGQETWVWHGILGAVDRFNGSRRSWLGRGRSAAGSVRTRRCARRVRDEATRMWLTVPDSATLSHPTRLTIPLSRPRRSAPSTSRSIGLPVSYSLPVRLPSTGDIARPNPPYRRGVRATDAMASSRCASS